MIKAPLILTYLETTSYLRSILPPPARAPRDHDVQAEWSPGARGCWEASSGPLGLHVVHFRSNRADRPTSRPPPRECSLGRSAPTRKGCVILVCPAPCPSRGTSLQPSRLAHSSRVPAKIRLLPRVALPFAKNIPAQRRRRRASPPSTKLTPAVPEMETAVLAT